MAFDDDWDAEGEVDYFDAAEAQNHLLIIRAFDAPKYYRTENNPDGMVHPGRGKDFEPFPNTVVRCAVADLDADGGPHIYPQAVLFPFSITRIAKSWLGKGPQLLMWRKTGNKQTDPYELRNMRGDEAAVKAGVEFLDAHPEFLQIAEPEPYDETPPRRERSRDDRGYDERRGQGYGDRRDYGRYDREDDNGWSHADRDRDGGRRTEPRRNDRGARDWGQHDDRGRGRDDRDRGRREGAYSEDPWSRDSGGSRDGSFMSRSANSSRNGFQDDEPPF